MQERTGVVTFKGQPMTLLGPELSVGQPAPDFHLVDKNLSPVNLATYAGKIKVLNVVPSLDTPVCDQQTRKFNEIAADLGESVVILTVSMDLPFAQARWCGAAGVDRVITLSDYQEQSFGKNYGVLIKELKLLTRAIIIVDSSDTVRYVQIVPEIAQLPDFDDALNALRRIRSG